MKKINTKGFTLVELLLVIAIIGILAAVLFVSLGSQRERARITAFKEQMRSLVPAITTCLDAAGAPVAPATGTADPICNPTGNHGNYLDQDDRIDCDGAGAYTITAGATNLVGTCTTTAAGTNCVATCDMQGCSFADCD